MEIRTRRWNDPVEPGDGTRILVSRYRPRALRKEHETWDEWQKALGPSVDLHADYYGRSGPPIGLLEYEVRYRDEMSRQSALIETLARRVASGETVTLLCSSACTDAAKCHRTLLREMILDAGRRR